MELGKVTVGIVLNLLILRVPLGNCEDAPGTKNGNKVKDGKDDARALHDCFYCAFSVGNKCLLDDYEICTVPRDTGTCYIFRGQRKDPKTGSYGPKGIEKGCLDKHFNDLLPYDCTKYTKDNHGELECCKENNCNQESFARQCQLSPQNIILAIAIIVFLNLSESTLD